MAATPQQIGEIFVQCGYVTRGELSAALEVQQETRQYLGEILVEQGKLSRLDLASALSAQWSVREPPFADPAYEPDQADRSVGEAVPLEVADRPSVVMVEKASAPTAERQFGDLEASSRAVQSAETGELLLRLESQLTDLSGRHTTDIRESQDASRQLRDRLDRHQTELSTQYAAITDAIRAASAQSSVDTEGLERRIQEAETGELLLRLESQLADLGGRHTTDIRESQDACRQLRDRLDRQQTELSTQYAAITDAIRAASAQSSVDTEGLDRRIQEQLDQVQANLTELRQQVQTLGDRKPTIEPSALAEKKRKREKQKHR